MAKKGGKKKGAAKTSASSAAVADGQTPAAEDLDGGKKKKGKKGKKGKKKGKLSPAEKRREQLEKACDELCSNKVFFENFTDRLDRWLISKGDILVSMFIQFDHDSMGLVSHEEFKSGLFDLNVPCNELEQHLLCRLLDLKDNGSIEYLDLSIGLKTLREKLLAKEEDEDNFDEIEEEPEDIEPIGPPTKVHRTPSVPLKKYEYPEHCPCCKMAICEPYKEKEPKYVELLVRIASFANMRNHPGHFQRVVHTHMPIVGLVQMIRKVTGLNSSRIGVFLDNTSDDPELLDYDKSLDDYKVDGGTKDQPSKVLLFYDYSVEFTGCPLLSCDFYFCKD